MKVGDHVKILVLPNHQEAIRRGRHAKHIYSWRGPMRIKTIKGTKYSLKYPYDNNMKFERHLPNIRKWNSPITEQDNTAVAAAAPYEALGDVEIGDFVFAKDEANSDIV